MGQLLNFGLSFGQNTGAAPDLFGAAPVCNVRPAGAAAEFFSDIKFSIAADCFQ